MHIYTFEELEQQFIIHFTIMAQGHALLMFPAAEEAQLPVIIVIIY